MSKASSVSSRAPEVEIDGYVALTLKVYPEDHQYVSECIELQTASCGDSIEEALENVKEATIQYLNAIEANGERERIFKRRNIPIYPSQVPEERRIVHVEARSRDIFSGFVLPLLSGAKNNHGATPAML